MAVNRTDRIGEFIKRDLNTLFQRDARTLCKGAMVTATVVRVTNDLSLARVYLSIFGHPKPEEVFEQINTNAKPIRGHLSRSAPNLRKMPELRFFIDDSLDYAEKIDDLLKK